MRRKIVSCFIAAALIASVITIPAFATTDDVTSVDSGMIAGVEAGSVVFSGTAMAFTTTLNMSADAVTAPNANFTYAVTSGDGQIFTDADGVSTEIFAGVTDNGEDAESANYESYITVYSSVFATSMYLDQDSVADNNYFEVAASVRFDMDAFDAPGIYHYVITAGTDYLPSGIIMDSDDTRHVYVYVVYGEDDQLEIANIVMTIDELSDETAIDIDGDSAADTATGTKSAGFTNSYGVDPGENGEPGEPGADPSENFIVENNVTGNMADKSKDFTFTLTNGTLSIDGDDELVVSGISSGTIFKVEDADGGITYVKYTSSAGFQIVTYSESENENGTTSASFTVATDATASFLLSGGESFTILSVVDGMTFEVTATDENNYTVYSGDYIDGESGEPTYSEDEQLTYNNEVDEETEANEGISFNPNYSQLVPETGVLIEFAPFVVMVFGAAGLLGFRFFRAAKKS